MNKESILNKKGFTLLELLIAVSIFGIISVMTVSVINYVPKLAKSETSQFSERTHVRRAVAEITDTIQSAKSVNTASMEFEMPNGDKIVYRYEGGDVNKYVNGVPQEFMESVAEFQISSLSEHLFNIHVKTAKEGKEYDFKVEKRRDIRTKTDAAISTISPTAAVFDKKDPENIDITVTLNGNNLVKLTNGSYELKSGEDYTVSGNTVTIKAGYLSGLNIGTAVIVFDVTGGKDPELTTEIKDTALQLKIEGNAFADDLARMYYPGNLQIDPYDDKWIITVTNAALDSNIDNGDVTITGLPAGIGATAAKGEEGNTIVLTLSGSASVPVSTTMTVEVVIKSSAVTNKSIANSDPIKVYMLPGATYGSPEHNLLFTNELEIVSNTDIIGDIVIGRKSTTTVINSNADILGTVYVDSSLTINSNFNIGCKKKGWEDFC